MGWDNLIVYGTEESKVDSGELVVCLTDAERVRTFGPDNFLVPPKWPSDEEWRRFNAVAAKEVAVRSEPGDLLLLAAGCSQALVAETNPHLIACEPGVGYEGVWAPHAAFESYAWQHYVYGQRGWDGRFFDRVIPNYFDVHQDFPHLNDRSGEHLLYVGRVVARKGLQAAADIAAATGRTLYVAGPGPTDWKDGSYISAPEVTIHGDVHYLGVLGVKERAREMANAYALLAPTSYVEPFGGVAVEAMMCGTPVIATDWGAFPETVENNVSGFRFRTLAEAVRAVEDARDLIPCGIRSYAEKRYSLKAVKPLFEEWFDALRTLNRKGWYELSACA